MSPFFFGPQERQLFGLFRPAQSGGTTAALLCNPFGQEAIRAHRLYRVLADSLSRSGVDVLRFDYFATGDSDGADAQGELEGWARDAAAAHEALKERSPAQRVVWLGTRLGAVIAMTATRLVARAPSTLVLWDGVFDGTAYLRQIGERNAVALEENFGAAHLPRRAGAASSGTVLAHEAVGFELGETLWTQLHSLTPATLPVPRAVRCEFVERDARGEVQALAETWRADGLATRNHALEHDFDWLALEAPGTALVAHHVLESLTRLIASPT